MPLGLETGPLVSRQANATHHLPSQPSPEQLAIGSGGWDRCCSAPDRGRGEGQQRQFRREGRSPAFLHHRRVKSARTPPEGWRALQRRARPHLANSLRCPGNHHLGRLLSWRSPPRRCWHQPPPVRCDRSQSRPVMAHRGKRHQVCCRHWIAAGVADVKHPAHREGHHSPRLWPATSWLSRPLASSPPQQTFPPQTGAAGCWGCRLRSWSWVGLESGTLPEQIASRSRPSSSEAYREALPAPGASAGLQPCRSFCCDSLGRGNTQAMVHEAARWNGWRLGARLPPGTPPAQAGRPQLKPGEKPLVGDQMAGAIRHPARPHRAFKGWWRRRVLP